MSTPFVGEIRMFGGNFAPSGWAFCSGQIVSIAENEVLFNLIGTTYGGDGQTTFALPDLRGRLPVHLGTALGSTFVLGQAAGVEQVTLTTNQIPSHTHPLIATSNQATGSTPSASVLPGRTALATTTPYGSDAPIISMSPSAISTVGGSQPHSNVQPFLCINFIISLFGVFPSPS
jgi:microcystin-dependent protein